MYNETIANEEKTATIELSEIQKKIQQAKERSVVVKKIEKYEKEIAKFEKSISSRKEKVKKLYEQL